MKLKIERGVIIAGQIVYPKTKDDKDVIVNLPEKDAKPLVNSGKASIADDKAKVTLKLLSQEEVDELNELKAEEAAAKKL